MEKYGDPELLGEGRVVAVIEGLIALMVVAAVFALLLGALMFSGYAVVAILVA